jgi:hypothetical protein
MKWLELSSCDLLTDSCIESLALGCSKLEILMVAHVTKLTDRSCFALANNCPELSKLGFFMCSNITNEGKRALIRGCRKLAGGKDKEYDRIRKSLSIIDRAAADFVATRKRRISPELRAPMSPKSRRPSKE